MKTIKKVLKILTVVVAAWIVAANLVSAGFFDRATTEAEVRTMIERAGGAENVSREAHEVLSAPDFKTASSFSFDDSETTNFPALSMLASHAHIVRTLNSFPATSNLPAHLNILYGPRSHLRYLVIADTNNATIGQFGPSGTQISSNIFFVSP